MKEYKLNPEESKTIMDMTQDAIDRGMVASYYETDKIEEIIDETTNEFGDYLNNVEFEIIIRVKQK